MTDTPYGMPPYVIERVMAKRGRLAVFDHFDPRKTALLVIDMQNFYVGEIPSVLAIIPNINRLAQRMRELGGPRRVARHERGQRGREPLARVSR